MLFRSNPLKTFQRALGRHKVLTSPEDLLTYSYDVSSERSTPEMVVLAEAADDIIQSVKFARDEGYRITPRGGGTGMSGGSVPLRQGMVLCTERMNDILGIDEENKTALVEPGVITATVQDEAAKVGLFYPPDPSSHKISSIGGNVAENAGGLRCVKYGTTKHYVQGLEFVSARGELCYTGILDSKNSIPDLTPLLVGSEGTLGIITKISLRLIDTPEARGTLRIFFTSMDYASNSVAEIMAAGILPSVCELMDKAVLDAITAYTGTQLPNNTEALLLIEVDGNREEIKGRVAEIESICNNRQAIEIASTENLEEAEQLWTLRRSISPSLSRLASGKMNEDVSVPRSRIPDLLNEVRRISQRYDLPIPCYGHAGDGNIHVNVMYDADDTLQHQRSLQAIEEVFKEVVRLDGSLSGEHGIGIVKREFMRLQMESAELDTLRKIKESFDPDGIFNPGKIIPEG
ncbi:glycolate oxidase subunit GlcD [candidate division LCP-89 bacterium B3_LCP]|uniref:Glycolate oxidase subunit GlcD n=1 Tax=candidate division LCP-89 bacterium B3_LCP TaxID=2012998 RepID=A0A532US05_UNCL8|nr:MAG: glycolate oxidase subunit GlcD [candidate division LCP-89 bacterium B3_LCP]